MKVVEAFWEKRNLGVDAIEITFDANDSLENVTCILKKIKAKYIVLKIPTHLTNLLFVVQDFGYKYIEDMVCLSSYLQKVSRNSIEQRLYDAISIDIMDENDMNILYNEVEEGIFDSDRIYLDTYFSHELAKKRYINWIKDERERGTEFLKYIYKGQEVGFFSLKEIDNGYYTSFIGGIYKKYRKSGIGAIVKVPEEVKKRNGKKVTTSVSTNNLSQIKALVRNGYTPESISHTFIKHF